MSDVNTDLPLPELEWGQGTRLRCLRSTDGFAAGDIVTVHHLEDHPEIPGWWGFVAVELPFFTQAFRWHGNRTVGEFRANPRIILELDLNWEEVK